MEEYLQREPRKDRGISYSKGERKTICKVYKLYILTFVVRVLDTKVLEIHICQFRSFLHWILKMFRNFLKKTLNFLFCNILNNLQVKIFIQHKTTFLFFSV